VGGGSEKGGGLAHKKKRRRTAVTREQRKKYPEIKNISEMKKEEIKTQLGQEPVHQIITF